MWVVVQLNTYQMCIKWRLAHRIIRIWLQQQDVDHGVHNDVQVSERSLLLAQAQEQDDDKEAILHLLIQDHGTTAGTEAQPPDRLRRSKEQPDGKRLAAVQL